MEQSAYLEPRIVNRERIMAETLAERDQQLLMAMDEIMSLRNNVQLLEQKLAEVQSGREQ